MLIGVVTWQDIDRTHLRELLKDEHRTESLTAEHNGVYLDLSRQRVTEETMTRLQALARACDVRGKIDAMFEGRHINVTEDRAVLHVATRAPRGRKIVVDGKDVVPDVHEARGDTSSRKRNTLLI